MPKDQGLVIAVDKVSGEFRTISDVPSGKDCNCICPNPDCGFELVAKKGEVMRHHFAHLSIPDSIRQCQETALHEAGKYAAAILIPHLHLPERKIETTSPEPVLTGDREYRRISQSIIWSPEQNTRRLSGDVEPAVPQIAPYRPDARLQTDLGEVFVEILVTHAAEPDKVSALQRANLAVLEVDLSDINRDGVTMDEIVLAVSEKAPRTWISEGSSDAKQATEEGFQVQYEAYKESEEQMLLALLRTTECPVSPPDEFIDRIALRGTSQSMPGLRRFPVKKVRKAQGFWMASVGPIHDVLLCEDFKDSGLQYLFNWYRQKKDRHLTVLNAAEDRITVETTDPLVMDEFARSALEPYRAVGGEFQFYSVHRMDHYPPDYPLDEPINREVSDAYGAKVFVGQGVPRQLVQDMLTSGRMDLIIDLRSPPTAYTTSKKASQLNQKRPAGGIRDRAIRCIKAGIGEFFIRQPDFARGKLYDIQIPVKKCLEVYRGELYFRVGELNPVRAYFNDANLQDKEGVLVKGVPLAENEFEVRLSSAFLKRVDQWVRKQFQTEKHAAQIGDQAWKRAFWKAIRSFLRSNLEPGSPIRSGMEKAMQKAEIELGEGLDVSLLYPDGRLPAKVKDPIRVYLHPNAEPEVELDSLGDAATMIATTLLISRGSKLDKETLIDNLIAPEILPLEGAEQRRLRPLLADEVQIKQSGGAVIVMIGKQTWPLKPTIRPFDDQAYVSRLIDDGTEIGFFLEKEDARELRASLEMIKRLNANLP